jgi:hypothetical protein
MDGGGGGDRTRPPNYKVPWNEGVAAARQIQLLILLTNLRPKTLDVLMSDNSKGADGIRIRQLYGNKGVLRRSLAF